MLPHQASSAQQATQLPTQVPTQVPAQRVIQQVGQQVIQLPTRQTLVKRRGKNKLGMKKRLHLLQYLHPSSHFVHNWNKKSSKIGYLKK